jgi:chromosome partitioning protein
MLTLNGLCSAHGVIIPMQCEYYALEGLSDLVNTIKQVAANFNPKLSVIGLLRVMYDPRVTLSTQVSDQLEKHFGSKVFKTTGRSPQPWFARCAVRPLMQGLSGLLELCR